MFEKYTIHNSVGSPLDVNDHCDSLVSVSVSTPSPAAPSVPLVHRRPKLLPDTFVRTSTLEQWNIHESVIGSGQAAFQGEAFSMLQSLSFFVLLLIFVYFFTKKIFISESL